MSTDDLPHSTPSAEGVAAAGLEAFLDAIDDAPDIELHSLIVMRHGKVIAEGWWSPYSPDRVHLLYSLSKSFTSTAAGLAHGEGLLDLDATVLSYFPELDAEITDRRSRAMKVRHVAAMASGHTGETLDRAMRADPTNLVRGFLLTPPDEEPGTVFAYNQPCTYTLAAIIQRQSGESLVDYLRPRLLDPLGIVDVGWIERPPGQNLGFSGLHATTDAIARLGQLYLQSGRWGDRQLLDPAWVAQATSQQVENPNEPSPDWTRGYGFQFWMSRHGYRGDGAYGQFCLVLPDQDMVIATTAATEDMQGLLDAVWTHVVPSADAAGDAPGDDGSPDRQADREADKGADEGADREADEGADTEADRRLADRLAHGALPPRPAKADPGDRSLWDGASFLSGATPAAEVWPPVTGPQLVSAELRAVDDGWRLALSDSGGVLDAAVGSASWALSEAGGVPVAVSGGWSDPDAFVADVIFLDSPHTLRVTCSGPDRTLSSVWSTVPLHPRSLLELRRP